MPSTIRLSVNKNLDSILKDLQKWKFPLLDNSEILKTILSEYYIQAKKNKKNDELSDLINSHPKYLVDKNTESRIAQSEKDIACDNVTMVDMHNQEEIKKYFEV
jgi:hypothetical protein